MVVFLMHVGTAALTSHARNSQDDGLLTGLLGGPLIAAAVLYISLVMSAASPSSDPMPPGWLVEAPMTLPNSGNPVTPLEALLLSRRYLVSQATFCATILLVHVSASWVTEARHRRKLVVPEGEVSSVPRKEGRRTYLYILFAVSITLWILCVRIALREAKLGIWQSAFVCAPRSWFAVLIMLTGWAVGFVGMSYFEVVASALFFQFSLYACVRVAHHGLTFGELALVAFGATVLFMELVNLTGAKVRTRSFKCYGIKLR